MESYDVEKKYEQEVDMKQDGVRRFQLRRVSAVLLGAGLVILTAAPAFAQEVPQRDVFFGETHVHTSWSFDAYIFGNTKTGPADAYRYAIGEPIDHPLGYKIQITHPLDWMGVTDHSEYVGTVRLANEPGSAISKLPIAEKLKVRDKADIQRIYLWLGYTMIDNKPIKELVDPQVAGTVWKEVVATADQFNKPGKFTAFCAYEWTSTPQNRNMHRNLIFLDSKKVPEVPFTSIDSDHPEDLWNWMDTQRKAGVELLAISHNANLSDGIMFPLEVDSKGRPIDGAESPRRDLFRSRKGRHSMRSGVLGGQKAAEHTTLPPRSRDGYCSLGSPPPAGIVMRLL